MDACFEKEKKRKEEEKKPWEIENKYNYSELF